MTGRRGLRILSAAVVVAVAIGLVYRAARQEDPRRFPFKCRQCGYEVPNMERDVFVVRDCPACGKEKAFCPALVCRKCGRMFVAWPRREGLPVKCPHCGVDQGR